VRRLDDVINMGIIRFSVQEIENALSQVHRHGSVGKWQICMSRQGYKPCLRLTVTGIDMSNPETFIEDIRNHMSGIKILQGGVESKLICQPEIQLAADIDAVVTATGKVKRVIYASDW
jgi:hypothetical protein